MCALGADATRAEHIRKLASEDYLERVEATRALWAQGPLAVEELKEAARSRDPEMALRARDLLRKIDLGIAPDTDPRIINLTERYLTANQTQKSTILHELRRLRAWRQILRLYAHETDASTRKNLVRMVEGIALHAARERISRGDQDGALEYLEMARSTAAGLMSIAAFHRARGTLEKEIEAAGNSDGKDDLRWLTALHRAAGDVDGAARSARAAGDLSVAVLMEMLGGDPLPWLNHAAATTDNDQEVASSSYARAAAARWRGDASIPELATIRRQLRSHDESVRLRSVAELLLLGETDAAWRSYSHHFPEDAFVAFDSVESVDQALAALGMDPEKPDFHGYITPLLRKVCQPPGRQVDDDDEDRDDAIRRLIAICGFLEKRGAHDMLDQWVAPAVLDFAIVHQARFTDLLSELFGAGATGAGAPELAMRVAAAWAGEDARRWGEMMIAAFGEEQGYPQWWDLLAKVAPDAPHADRLRGMLALFGYTKDADNHYEPWIDAVWAHFEKSPDPVTVLQSLEFLASNISDIQLIERLRKANAENANPGGDDVTYGNLLVDTAAGRWGDVADMFLTQIAALADQGEARADVHAYASACLRNAGRHEEADAHEAWVELLALGDLRANLSVAQAFAFGRDYDRAVHWYRRAVIEAPPGDNRFKQALRAYVGELMEKRDFARIAAGSEILALLEISDTNFGVSPIVLTRLRQQADFARALSLPPEEVGRAREMLRSAHAIMPTDGGLADHFFPSLLESRFRDMHDELFENSWQMIIASLESFPNADNTMNTAVWFASRSARRLEESKKIQQRALALYPRSPAYLDTLAEVYFAMGNRAEAVRLGALAMRYMPHDPMIIRQYERFLHGAMPVP